LTVCAAAEAVRAASARASRIVRYIVRRLSAAGHDGIGCTPALADQDLAMIDRSRALPALAAVLGFLAVAAGAFGAHGASDPLAKEALRTGAQYGLAHALAVFAALSFEAKGGRTARLASWLFIAGGAVFSVSLYLLALSGQRWLGAVTPLGGLAMMAGWLTLAWASWSARGPRT
jgi:uncharacterized membrane protein YgdD (TMEM256/DUF423 family)